MATKTIVIKVEAPKPARKKTRTTKRRRARR